MPDHLLAMRGGTTRAKSKVNATWIVPRKTA
jgi:hypothetical protein